jgi:hypothetical protein
MARNKLNDLSNHLFEQIERLNDESLTGEKLNEEIQRAKAMAGLATPIVNAAKTFVDALKLSGCGDIQQKQLGQIISITEE